MINFKTHIMQNFVRSLPRLRFYYEEMLKEALNYAGLFSSHSALAPKSADSFGE